MRIHFSIAFEVECLDDTQMDKDMAREAIAEASEELGSRYEDFIIERTERTWSPCSVSFSEDQS